MSCLIRNEQDLEISRRDDNRSLTLSEAVDWISYFPGARDGLCRCRNSRTLQSTTSATL